ncbi:hypothetical protein DFA_00248 [Cavenderia fasciculata]|uniref:Transmembrane protein n=1 Tax=Cavenderia fasciculata TaxID=261658 RepID=F4PY10_CACFS|nr:uncharacterized protein DFA_00248 [Cavenderia fasciculata]EGG19670.1 hypothetical protein DFA_00248 [Cavenderia fasciculata]|eukprot:XP_004357964.1 hypothetical protein DFA_00248 [Cavenderia fasciculata]
MGLYWVSKSQRQYEIAKQVVELMNMIPDESQNDYNSLVLSLLNLSNQDYRVRKLMATRQSTKILIQITYTYIRAYYKAVRGTQPSETQIDTVFIRLLYSDLTSSAAMSLLNNLLYHFDKIEDIPFEDMMYLVREGGFPMEVMVGNVLANFILSRNSINVIRLYFYHGIHTLFFKLLASEVGNQFDTIRKATKMMVYEIGRIEDRRRISSSSSSDQLHPMYKDDDDAMRQMYDSISFLGPVPKFIHKFSVDHRERLLSIVLSTLISFSCGATFGWKYHGGSIKHSLIVGTVWGTLRLSRSLLMEYSDRMTKDNPSLPQMVLQMGVVAPLCFLNMLTLLTFPRIGFHVGLYLLEKNDQWSRGYRKFRYLQNQLYNEFKSKIYIDTFNTPIPNALKE